MTAPYAIPTTIPGPRPMPLLGVYGNLIRLMRDPAAYLRYLHAAYGDIVTLASGSAAYVFVFSPEYNQLVLSDTGLFHALDPGSSPLRMPPDSSLRRLFVGLTHMNGEQHKQQRRLMLPAFHKRRIEAYRDDIVALTERKIAGWMPGQDRDLLRETRELTLWISTKTMVGLDPDHEGQRLCRLLEQWMKQVFSLPVMLLPFNLPGLPYRRLLALSEALEGEIRAMIEQKRASGIDQGDVLSMLLRAQDDDGSTLTDAEVIGQTNTLFVSGHATTASVLTWTLFLLAQHPVVMADLLDELTDVLHGAAPTIDQLARLTLLEDVLKESMRLLPPALWWSRTAAADCELHGYHIPQGAHVVYSPYITHRNPELYPQPDRFLPERWRTINPRAYEYIPFSAGPRMCPGASIAMLQMKLVLPILLQRHRLALPPRAIVDRSGPMLSAPKHGLPMRIYPQDRQFNKSEVAGSIHAMVDLS